MPTNCWFYSRSYYLSCRNRATPADLRSRAPLQHYQPEQLVGKQIICVANLAPRTMRGEVSNGMLLAATDPATGKVIIMSPSEPVSAGSKVS